MPQNRGTNSSTGGGNSTTTVGDTQPNDGFFNLWGAFRDDSLAFATDSEKARLKGIKDQQSVLENSEWNTAKSVSQLDDFYGKSLAASNRAAKLVEVGLTTDEENAAKNNFAQNANLNTTNAINAGGGGLASYINSINNTDNNKFNDALVSQDQAAKRSNSAIAMDYLRNLGGVTEKYQDIDNLNFNKQIMAETALGQAEGQWYDQRNQNKLAAKQIEAAALSGLSSNLFSTGASTGQMMGGMSDKRLKENIVYSHTENGHKVYEFNYIGNPQKYSGVMAQEAIEINPSAVSEENGYMKVDYSKIGVEMKKIN